MAFRAGRRCNDTELAQPQCTPDRGGAHHVLPHAGADLRRGHRGAGWCAGGGAAPVPGHVHRQARLPVPVPGYERERGLQGSGVGWQLRGRDGVLGVLAAAGRAVREGLPDAGQAPRAQGAHDDMSYESPGCAYCPPSVRACRHGESDTRGPGFCPSKVDDEAIERAWERYEDPEVRRIAYASALVESTGYCRWTRVEEICAFADRK